MNWIIGGIIILALAAGGAYYAAMPSDDVMTKTEGSGDTVMKDDVMEKEDAMMGDEGAVVKKDDAMMKGEGVMMQKGSYEEYSPEKLARALDGEVLLFFHADWCPICRSLDAELKAKAATLSGVHILKVNYDTAVALKQKYGVTYQYTFVQVDEQGAPIAKWGDARNLADVLARVQ